MKFEVRQDRTREVTAPEIGFATRPSFAPEPATFLSEEILLARDDTPDDVEPATGRIAAIVAVSVIVLWLGAMLWLARGTLFDFDPVVLAGFIAALCTVPILVALVWLLVQRNSRAEAHRFGITARAMQAEAASLERSVATINRALEVNRAALAEQVSALMVLGDATQQRLSGIGSAMTAEIERADAHARALSNAAGEAEARVNVLLAQVPRARAEVEDATRMLDRAGALAKDQAAALDTQLIALGEHGREAAGAASGAAERLAGHLARIETTSDTAGVRLEAVTAQAAHEVEALLGRTADAIDGARQDIAAQGDTMLTMIAAHRSALDAAARDSADVLAERIGTLEDMIQRLATRLDAERHAGDAMVAELEGGITRVETQLNALHHQGAERTQLLAASISALGGSADAMTEALRAGDAMATHTIGTTETLLIALDSAAREIDETLPDALTRLDERIASSRRIVVQAKPELLALVTAAESTHDAIEAIASVIADQRRTLDQLSAGLLDTLADGRAKADALGQVVDDTIGRTHRFAEEAAPRLVDALLRVRDTAAVAADKARETLATVIPEAADRLEAAAADALRRASGDTVERQVAALIEATDAAVTASTRAVERLSAQIQAVADGTAIVETRLEDVRAEREASQHDSFARRSALLIESLNSAAIDLTKSFAPEVADSAWAAYLKGDRGVFTRRAVRIVDTGTARDIARLYDEDARFRDATNRYIHDFEAMLRGVLAERDGSPMGVTLLSSDMGKLYVALAQAIERLR
ncbi:MAG TPA: hypothetical protein VF695_10455 [Sphingomonas sp.]